MDILQSNLLHRVNIGDLLGRTAARFPDKAALIEGDRVLDYTALSAGAARAAQAFAALGICHGDRVAFLCRNSGAYVTARLGLALIGAIAVPINVMLRQEDIAVILEDARPSIVIADAGLRSLAAGAGESVRRFQIGGNDADWPSFEELVEKAPSDEPQVIVRSDDIATLIYTTGTEAAPKGVMLSHLNHLMALIHLMADINLSRNDVVLNDLPLFHIAGTTLLLGTLLLGGTGIVSAAPDATEILTLTERHRVTRWTYPPTLFTGLLGHPLFGKPDLSSLKAFTIFGGAVPDKARAAWDARCPGLVWHNYWGQSEGTAVGTTSAADRHVSAANAIGRVDFGIAVRVVNEGCEVGPGQVGELLTRGPAVMHGYWNRPDLTDQTLAGGWLHTGDLGYRDESGEFYFVDRKKDMIKTGGENVSAAEVETVLASHPQVAAAAVIGLPDLRWTEAVTACVVPTTGANPDPEELVAFCKTRLAGFKVPKTVIIRASLPLSPAGKLMKRELKQELLATAQRAQP